MMLAKITSRAQSFDYRFWNWVLFAVELMQITSGFCVIFCALHFDAFLALVFSGAWFVLRSLVPFVHRASHRHAMWVIRKGGTPNWERGPRDFSDQ